VQQATALGDRHDGYRIRQAVCNEVRAFDRVDGNIDRVAAAP